MNLLDARQPRINTLLLLKVAAVVVVTLVMISIFVAVLPHIQKVVDDLVKESNKIKSQRELVKTTSDCTVLKDSIVLLVSDGFDDKEWFKGFGDTTLKIAKEKHKILCEDEIR